MADEESKNDYVFCVLCRKNHDQGRKHIYSKRHRKALENVLSKFGRKVDEVRKYLYKPSVEDGELEPGARFWCHFCNENVSKHITDREVTITYGGVFEHFASKNHHKYLHKYWREHGAEKEKKSQFLVSQDQYISFKVGVDKALKEHEEVMEKRREKEAEKIKQIEEKQRQESQKVCGVTNGDKHHQKYISNKHQSSTKQYRMSLVFNKIPLDGMKVLEYGEEEYLNTGSDQWYPWQMDLDDGVPGSSSGFGTTNDSLSLPKRIQTASAFGTDLTCIDVQELKHGEDNIHTGATPPWLKDDDDDDDDDDTKEMCIGPSLEDFKKHVQHLKKSTQNPNRVGANFDRDKQTNDEWLPSFGRVWNQGPRWQSRHEFRSEHRKKEKKS